MNSSGQAKCEAEAIPVEDLSLTLDGARMRFLRAGSGPALLLVHGLLGYSFSWRHTLPVLAGNATVYAPDLPGAGFSDPMVGMDCGLRACAERLLRFMDAVGVHDCDLLGTSHGAAVAMMAAAVAPQRIRRLILVDPVNPWSTHGRTLSIVLSSPVIAPAFREFAPRLPMLQRFYFRRLFGDTRRIRAGTLEGYLKPLRRPSALKYGLSILRSWNRDLGELESVLPRISHIATLLIWGSLDVAVDPASAARLQSQFRTCRLLMLEGVGHLPYEEVPEEFNRAVAEFLTGNGPCGMAASLPTKPRQ
jgi:pimeloyl-ACP methyl ester carboxylesterase